MKSRFSNRLTAGVLVIIALCVLGYFLISSNSAKHPPAIQRSTEQTDKEAGGQHASVIITSNIFENTADASSKISKQPTSSPNVYSPTNQGTTNLAPLTVLDNARVMIHNYQDRFGENPVGDNSEITAALLGKNPKQVNFMNSESGLRINANNEMIDAWGTPFFFHQISSKQMEIRSAGEDKKMWTFDDLITR